MKKITFILLLLVFSPVHASDYAKEQRWIEQVADFIIDGDVVMLKADNHEFMGIYTEADEKPKNRAMIVVHGIGAHPDWVQVVQPIRVEMTQHGWNTLSIQMPILSNDSHGSEYEPLFDEVAPRIEAAIQFLKAEGAKEIVLVAHSMGAVMSSYYFAHHPNSAITRFVAIGLNGSQKSKKMNATNSIKSIKIPMLDLMGSEDLPGVISSKSARSKAAKQAGNTAYIQQVVRGANHFFDGRNQELINAVSHWLN